MNATGSVQTPSMIAMPPKNSSIPPMPICESSGGRPPGIPPNQPRNFVLPAWKNSSPDTTRSRNHVISLARFIMGSLLAFVSARSAQARGQSFADGGPFGGENRVERRVADAAIPGRRVCAQDAVEAAADPLDVGARAGVARIGLQ